MSAKDLPSDSLVLGGAPPSVKASSEEILRAHSASLMAQIRGALDDTPRARYGAVGHGTRWTRHALDTPRAGHGAAGHGRVGYGTVGHGAADTARAGHGAVGHGTRWTWRGWTRHALDMACTGHGMRWTRRGRTWRGWTRQAQDTPRLDTAHGPGRSGWQAAREASSCRMTGHARRFVDRDDTKWEELRVLG